jgi:WD40 repeat protein
VSEPIHCPNGHAFDRATGGTLLQVGGGLLCPVCGAPVLLPGHGSQRLNPDAFTATLPPPGSPVQESADRAAPREWPTVPGYEIVGELGRGGMGVVYQALQLSLNRLVALKMVLAGGHAGPDQLARFRSEAQAVASLQHPNIVQVYEVGEHNGTPYFSLEYIEGGSLAQKLGGTPVAARPAAQLIQTVAEAVHVAHQRGIVHRDLTPGNILLTSSGVPKITDFGLAKRLDADAGRTQTGAILGTPSYMAPEQAGGKIKEIGPGTDIYALGTILYELLTGRPPFKADTVLETLHQVVMDEPVPPVQLQPKVPRDLETICLKCLQKEPRKRYASAEALASDLRRFLAGESIEARPTPAWERGLKWARRRPALAALIGVSTLAVLVLGGLGWLHSVQLQTALTGVEVAQAATEAQRKRAILGEGEALKQLDFARRSLFVQQLTQVAGLWEPEPSRGRELLDDRERCPPEMRDFAWGLYHRLCQRDRQTLKGHAAWVLAVACAPDGRLLASGDEQGEVRLWDAATGAERGRWQAHEFGVNGVAFSPDSRTLATCGGDGRTRFWDIATRAEEISLKGHHDDAVWALAFSPDGKTLATASIDKSVRLWNTATGELAATLRGHGNWVNAVAFAPDGKKLVSASWDETARLWDLTAQPPASKPLTGHSHWVWAAAFSPDGRRLATASEDKTIKLWDADTGRELRTFSGHTAGVMALAFAPDGRTLASAGGDQTLKLWDSVTGATRTTLQVATPPFFIPLLRDYIVSGQEKVSIKGHSRPGFSLAYSPDGQTLFTGGHDGTVTLWEAVKRPERAELKGHTDLVRGVAFSPDGKTAATASWDRTVRLWDAATGQQRKTLAGHRHWVWTVAFAPDGQTLATGSEDRTVKLWDVATGECRATLTGHSGAIWSVAFAPDGRTLASGGWEVKLWDVASGQEKASWTGHEHLVRCAAFSQDGQRLATASFDHTAKIWDIASGRVEKEMIGHDHWVWSVAFSPDGKLLATGSGDGTAMLWDVGTGTVRARLEGHTGGVRSVAFAGDRTLATGSEDLTVRLWDLSLEVRAADQDAGGSRLLPIPPLRGHTAEVTCVTFSPDGRTLASASADGTVKLWEAAPYK